MPHRGRPLPPNPYCQLLNHNIEKLDITGATSITLKHWSANEGAYLKFCLDRNIKSEGEIRMLIDQRLQAIGKLNYREVVLLKGGEQGRADRARSPAAVAYAIEQGSFKEPELARLAFEHDVDAKNFMLEERRKLLDDVYNKLLAV